MVRHPLPHQKRPRMRSTAGMLAPQQGLALWWSKPFSPFWTYDRMTPPWKFRPSTPQCRIDPRGATHSSDKLSLAFVLQSMSSGSSSLFLAQLASLRDLSFALSLLPLLACAGPLCAGTHMKRPSALLGFLCLEMENHAFSWLAARGPPLGQTDMMSLGQGHLFKLLDLGEQRLWLLFQREPSTLAFGNGAAANSVSFCACLVGGKGGTGRSRKHGNPRRESSEHC